MKNMELKYLKDVIDVLGKDIIIGDVDMFGMLGRELHPDEKDKGLKGKIISLDIVYQNDVELKTLDLIIDEDEVLNGTGFVSFIVRLENGEIKQFCDYELMIDE